MPCYADAAVTLPLTLMRCRHTPRRFSDAADFADATPMAASLMPLLFAGCQLAAFATRMLLMLQPAFRISITRRHSACRLIRLRHC